MSENLKLPKDMYEVWNNLGDSDYLEKLANSADKTTKKEIKVISSTIKSELVELLKSHSEQTIKEAKAEMMKHLAKEEYFKANEMRVLIIFHTNNIKRVEKILEGKNPFI